MKGLRGALLCILPGHVGARGSMRFHSRRTFPQEPGRLWNSRSFLNSPARLIDFSSSFLFCEKRFDIVEPHSAIQRFSLETDQVVQNVLLSLVVKGIAQAEQRDRLVDPQIVVEVALCSLLQRAFLSALRTLPFLISPLLWSPFLIHHLSEASRVSDLLVHWNIIVLDCTERGPQTSPPPI